MKKINVVTVLVLVALFLSSGCGKLGSLRQKKTSQENKPSEPRRLEAKMIDNLAIPAVSEIVSDKPDEKCAFGKCREIDLNIPAAVFDVDNFYRTEMLKNGWTNSDQSDDKLKDAESVVSVLRFNTEKEKAEIKIVSRGDDKCETTIRVGENPEYTRKLDDEKREAYRETRNNQRIAEREKTQNDFPMPACAAQSNSLMESDALTLTGECTDNIGAVTKFFKTEAPRKNWILKDQNAGGAASDSTILIFTKGSQKSLVTLIKKTENSISLNVRISK